MPGVRPAARFSTYPAMLTRSSTRRVSREYINARREVTSGVISVASRRPELEGGGFHSCLPVVGPVPATAGLGI